MTVALVTGGAGFIGSHLVDELLRRKYEVVVLDKLTYAGNRRNLPWTPDPCPIFYEGDIADRGRVRNILESHTPDVCFHLAAETHVSRSIETADEFIHTNLLGTFVLLDEWVNYGRTRVMQPRFIHVSTDEVYGSVAHPGFWSIHSPYDPRNPYSASKAGSDFLVRAWMNTHGVQANIVHASNNYGPRQHREKLIPAVISAVLTEQPIRIHGDGRHMRDWLHVGAMVRALLWIYEQGKSNMTYDVPGHCERTTWEIVMLILSRMRAKSSIEFVPDRLGNDRRYSMEGNIPKWNPGPSIEEQIDAVIEWYRQEVV